MQNKSEGAGSVRSGPCGRLRPPRCLPPLGQPKRRTPKAANAFVHLLHLDPPLRIPRPQIQRFVRSRFIVLFLMCWCPYSLSDFQSRQVQRYIPTIVAHAAIATLCTRSYTRPRAVQAHKRLRIFSGTIRWIVRSPPQSRSHLARQTCFLLAYAPLRPPHVVAQPPAVSQTRPSTTERTLSCLTWSSFFSFFFFFLFVFFVVSCLLVFSCLCSCCYAASNAASDSSFFESCNSCAQSSSSSPSSSFVSFASSSSEFALPAVVAAASSTAVSSSSSSCSTSS